MAIGKQLPTFRRRWTVQTLKMGVASPFYT